MRSVIEALIATIYIIMGIAALMGLTAATSLVVMERKPTALLEGTFRAAMLWSLRTSWVAFTLLALLMLLLVL